MYIIGAGGHGKVVAELAQLNVLPILSFIDENKVTITSGSINVIHDFPSEMVSATIAIGNNLVRKRIAQTYAYNYLKLIHPRANISGQATIGVGSVVIAGATINIDAMIGEHVIVNTNASVGHDCIIGNFVHIAPNAALAGNVIVGEGTHIGMGATVIQGVKIGKWCVVGAGSVVINDIPNGAMVVGNPARVIKEQVITSRVELIIDL
ncbi:putative acetyltransferase EpsM [compost metagenome]